MPKYKQFRLEETPEGLQTIISKSGSEHGKIDCMEGTFGHTWQFSRHCPNDVYSFICKALGDPDMLEKITWFAQAKKVRLYYYG